MNSQNKSMDWYLDRLLEKFEEIGKRERESMQWRLDIMKEITTSLKASTPDFRAASSPPSQAPPSPTPTTCSTKCPNNVNPQVMESSSRLDEETAPMIFLELGDVKDKVHDPYIVTEDFLEVTPTKCSMKCSSPNAEPYLTMVAVATCATTATTSMELVAAKDTTGVTYIDTPNYSKVTHAKCSTVSLDVDDGTSQAVVVFSIMKSVSKVVPISIEPMDIFLQRLMTDLKQYTSMPVRCLLKCPNDDKEPLMEHPKRNPWPPPTHNYALGNGQALQLTLFVLNCLGIILQWMPPWLPLIGLIQEHVCEQEQIMCKHWDPGKDKVHQHKILLDDWLPQYYFHLRFWDLGDDNATGHLIGLDCLLKSDSFQLGHNWQTSDHRIRFGQHAVYFQVHLLALYCATAHPNTILKSLVMSSISVEQSRVSCGKEMESLAELYSHCYSYARDNRKENYFLQLTKYLLASYNAHDDRGRSGAIGDARKFCTWEFYAKKNPYKLHTVVICTDHWRLHLCEGFDIPLVDEAACLRTADRTN
uniref:Uncharacterized protein n=1 Tax=Oryza rufipogon TaxID=4529 RepID=A0A0E0NIZ3_ORYRU